MAGWLHGTARCATLCALVACRPSHEGELSIEQMGSVVAREQGSFDACYQAALEKTPYEHELQIHATLRIRPDGTVAKVGLDQTGLRGMGDCIAKAIERWQFPHAKVETRASLPIIFRPKVVKSPPPDLQLPPGFKILQPE
jgi:hypothetical protein